MSILHKEIYRFNAIPVRIPMVLFTEIEKNNAKICRKHKRTQIGKAVLRNKNKTRGIILSDFKPYYKVTLIKMVLYWHKNRRIEQSYGLCGRGRGWEDLGEWH